MERFRTKKLFEQATQLIPGGVNSPVRSFRNLGISPMVVDSGYQDCIVDVDQHTYIDFCMSWGALILGHAPEVVVKKVQERVAKGSTFGVTCQEEIQIAAWMTKQIKPVEKVRFVSSGTEAVMTAIRLARAFTKAKYIIKFDGNYHGHVDALLVKAGSYLHKEPATEGVLKETVDYTISLPYNDLAAVKEFFKEFKEPIAAILIEPVAGNMGVVPADPVFLQYLKEQSVERKALLIFDEVISFFRVGLLGAYHLYGIEPDLICFGKIIGGGFPAAAVGGSREIMDQLAPIGNVYQAGTLSGNPVAMVAGLATLEEISKPQFYEELFEKTENFLKPIRLFFEEQEICACVNSCGAMFTIFVGAKSISNSQDLQKLDHDLFRKLFQYLFVHGVYIPPAQQEAWFLSSAHTEKHLEKAQKLIIEFFEKQRNEGIGEVCVSKKG
jgi:glutamate-1-semialdehyde 2,1-aminomutase